jgi:hypothetical protein
MPYKNIVYIKLFLELFDGDDRFLYQLNESQQLLFIKMLFMAGRTGNAIPKNHRYICNKINYAHLDAFDPDIKRIMEVFPGLQENGDRYYFKNFSNLHNQLIKSRISQGYPSDNPYDGGQDIQRYVPDKDKDNTKNTQREDKYYYVNLWNSKSLPKVQMLTPARTTSLLARMKEKPFVERYEELLDKIIDSPFLMGKKPSKTNPNWRASFDWVIKNSENYVKVLEDKYKGTDSEVFRQKYNL